MTREVHIRNAILMGPRIIRIIAGGKAPTRLNVYLNDLIFRAIRRVRRKSPLLRRLIEKHPFLRRLVQSFLNR